MLSFLKIAFNRYGWVVLVATLVWMYVLILQGESARLKERLEEAELSLSVAQQQLHVNAVTISVLEATASAQHQLMVIEDEAVEAIEEAPNANEPVPPDVAIAWANGINSLRASPGADGGVAHSTRLAENSVREAGDAVA
jgi:hypothetical protein